jgi:hypothetical protein
VSPVRPSDHIKRRCPHQNGRVPSLPPHRHLLLRIVSASDFLRFSLSFTPFFPRGTRPARPVWARPLSKFFCHSASNGGARRFQRPLEPVFLDGARDRLQFPKSARVAPAGALSFPVTSVFRAVSVRTRTPADRFYARSRSAAPAHTGLRRTIRNPRAPVLPARLRRTIPARIPPVTVDRRGPAVRGCPSRRTFGRAKTRTSPASLTFSGAGRAGRPFHRPHLPRWTDRLDSLTPPNRLKPGQSFNCLSRPERSPGRELAGRRRRRRRWRTGWRLGRCRRRWRCFRRISRRRSRDGGDAGDVGRHWVVSGGDG